MKQKSIIFVLCLILLPAIISFAEYYQYLDEQGVKHFTDNILEVPKDQRKNMGVHKSVKSSEETTIKEKNPTQSENSITFEALEIKKKALEDKYNALRTKREKLIAQQKSMDKKIFNEMTILLNNEIKEYQKEKTNYEDLVNIFNSQTPSDSASVEPEQ